MASKNSTYYKKIVPRQLLLTKNIGHDPCSKTISNLLRKLLKNFKKFTQLIDVGSNDDDLAVMTKRNFLMVHFQIMTSPEVLGSCLEQQTLSTNFTLH